jgi:hypothetical protein
MKIATCNVNGVNGRLPVLLRWLAESEPDIVCLQELKAPQEKFPLAAIENAGYSAIWNGQKNVGTAWPSWHGARCPLKYDARYPAIQMIAIGAISKRRSIAFCSAAFICRMESWITNSLGSSDYKNMPRAFHELDNPSDCSLMHCVTSGAGTRIQVRCQPRELALLALFSIGQTLETLHPRQCMIRSKLGCCRSYRGSPNDC